MLLIYSLHIFLGSSQLEDPRVGVGGWGASGPKQEPPGDGDLVPAPDTDER